MSRARDKEILEYLSKRNVALDFSEDIASDEHHFPKEKQFDRAYFFQADFGAVGTEEEEPRLYGISRRSSGWVAELEYTAGRRDEDDSGLRLATIAEGLASKEEAVFHCLLEESVVLGAPETKFVNDNFRKRSVGEADRWPTSLWPELEKTPKIGNSFTDIFGNRIAIDAEAKFACFDSSGRALGAFNNARTALNYMTAVAHIDNVVNTVFTITAEPVTKNPAGGLSRLVISGVDTATGKPRRAVAYGATATKLKAAISAARPTPDHPIQLAINGDRVMREIRKAKKSETVIRLEVRDAEVLARKKAPRETGDDR